MPDEFGSSEAGKKGGEARARKLTPEERREIARQAAQARWSQASPIRPNPLSVRKLPPQTTHLPIGPNGQPSLFVDKEKEIDGVGMGVLSDGTAFLTGRGLARLWGVSNARIVELGQEWDVVSTNAMAE